MEADRKEKERQISELKNEVKSLNEKIWIIMSNIPEKTPYPFKSSYP